MILAHRKTKWRQSKLPKAYMQTTISISCMFIRVYDVSYVETQCNHSKLCNYISSLEIVKMTIKLCKRFFFHEINKNMQIMFCTLAGMTSLTPDTKLRNFINSWTLIKTPHHFGIRSPLIMKFISEIIGS